MLHRDQIANRVTISPVGESATSELSYGFDPHGYTFRLAPDGMRLLDWGRVVLDPKAPDPSAWITVPSTPQIDIGPGQMVLGWSIERFTVPSDITGIIAPKSCYSRVGLVVMGGVVHAGWDGHILVEMLNKTTHPIRVYADEGIASVLFWTGGVASKPYAGRYQGQGGTR